MAYKVIKYFIDLQDNNHVYNVGDEYPRNGVPVLPSRIRELASDENRQKCPLIEEIPEPESAESVKKRRKNSENEE